MADKNKETESELEEASSGADGTGYLDGMAPKIIKPLIEKAKYIETDLKPAFGAARDALTAAKDQLSVLAHKHIEHFSPPDENGTRVYHAGGVLVQITFDKEKIVTKLDKEEE